MANVYQNSAGNSIPSILPPVTDPSTLPMPGTVKENSGGGQVPSILPLVTEYAGSATHATTNTGTTTPPQTQGRGPALLTPVLLAPIDDCQGSVTVLNVTPGAQVDVYVIPNWFRTSMSLEDLGYYRVGISTLVTGPAFDPLAGGGNQVEVPLYCSLHVGDKVQAIETFPSGTTLKGIGNWSKPITVVSHVPYSCKTQHYDNARTGWYPYSGLTWPNPADPSGGGSAPAPSPTPLTPVNVGGLKKIMTMPVDGQVYTQPLYLHQQFFPGIGPRNAIYVATERNYLYAFDADGVMKNGILQYSELWSRSLLKPGEREIRQSDIGTGCNSTGPYQGVTGTPVIDCGCNAACECTGQCQCGSIRGCPNRCGTPTIYLVSHSAREWPPNSSGPSIHHYLHAIDAITGEERANSPVEIIAEVEGSGVSAASGGSDGHNHLLFQSLWHLQRAALLLQNGIIYVCFAGECDLNLVAGYHGWVMAYDAHTLQQKKVFCTTPEGTAGAVWMSGMGPAGDGHSLYFSTGNGGLQKVNDQYGGFNADIGGRNYGNCVLKLSSDLCVQSWFSPQDQYYLQNYDSDLGSGGVLLIPTPQFGASPNQIAAGSPPAPNQLVVCGKDGDILVLNRDGLGGYTGPAHDVAPSSYPGTNPNAISEILLWPGLPIPGLPPTGNSQYQPGVWGEPAYFNSFAGQFVYFCGSGYPLGGPVLKGGYLCAFQLINGVLMRASNSTNIFQEFAPNGEGGATPIVTSDQQINGIVWAITRRDASNRLHLRAYDALNLALQVFPASGADGPANECGEWVPNGGSPGGGGSPLIEPMVINGRVYVGSNNAVTVFSL